MKAFGFGLALIAAVPLTPGFAQTTPGMDVGAKAAPTPCTAPVVVPGFEQWGKGTPAQQLAAGSFSSLVLAPVEAVKFSPPLNRAPRPGQKGGVYGLTLSKAGTYRFALGAGAWLDVVDSRGRRVTSIAHEHGPACSGITKIVDYALEAGIYVVQFSATDQSRLQVMLIAR